MSPLASWDVFTGFSPNSGNDLAETLFPCTKQGKQEAAQTQQIFQTLTTENVNSPMLE